MKVNDIETKIYEMYTFLAVHYTQGGESMYYSEFGENLKKLRIGQNLTQKDFGAKVGLSKAVVSKYEDGLGYPTFETLIHIAKFFSVTTDYLLGVAGEKTINLSGLSDSQIETLQRIITEFKKNNK